MPLEIARAFQLARMADKGFKFLLVGYKDETPYARKVKMLSGRDGIEVAHAVYDREILYALRENAFCYVHGNSVGGTNPALLEAMASCPRVMAIDGPFSREVLGDTGSFFSPNKLASIFPSQCSSPKKCMDMRARVKQRYDWDAVTASYVELVEKRSVSYSGRIEETLAVCYEGKRRQEKTPGHQRFRR